MAKIPLKTRKSIKAALEKAEAHTKKASQAFGKELSFVDNTTELYEKLQAYGRSEDNLFNLGDEITPYVEQFAKVLIEFCKNVDNKEQLEVELTTGKFGVRIDPREKVEGENLESRWWVLEDGVLWMETTLSYFGPSYVSYYSLSRLQDGLGKGDSMPLNTRKSLKEGQTKIDKAMKEASKLFGKDLSWVDNYQEIFDKLKAAERSESYLFSLGDEIAAYADRVAVVFKDFCKDQDNKEALEEVLTSGKIGIKFVEENPEKWWQIDDGVLWLATSKSYFGTSYLSYYSCDRLERIL